MSRGHQSRLPSAAASTAPGKFERMTRRYTSDSGMMLIKVGGRFTEVSDLLGWVILFTFLQCSRVAS